MNLVKVSRFKGPNAKANKNGKMPLWITYLSGPSIPSDALVVDGSVAETSGFKEGDTLVLDIKKSKEQPFENKMRNRYSYTTVDTQTAATFFGSILSNVESQGVVRVIARDLTEEEVAAVQTAKAGAHIG